MRSPSYWHGFGHVVPEGSPVARAWLLVVAGPFDHAVPHTGDWHGVPWLHTWSHDPTEAEKAALTPKEFQE